MAVLLQKISRLSLYGIVLLVPVFFLPLTLETLELNKYYLFYGLTMLSLAAFLGHAIAAKKFTIRRTPLDIALVVLWLAYLLSAILSKDRLVSFFGDFSSLGLSFIGISTMLVFYFLVVQHVESVGEIMKIVYLTLASGALASLYFLVKVSKLAALAGWLPTFSAVNVSNGVFGVYLAVIFILALSLLAIRTRSYALDGFGLAVALLTAVSMVAIGFRVIWIVLAVALFFALVFFMTQLDAVRKIWASVVFGLFVLTIVLTFVQLPQALTATLPVEIFLGRGVSQDIAFDALTAGAKTFLFGTGPGTFGINFSQFRPPVLNLNVAWNVRFTQSYNSVFDWISTLGLLASLAFLGALLILVGSVFGTWFRQMKTFKTKKKKEADEDVPPPPRFYDSPLVFWGIVSAWMTLAVSLFIINFGAVHWMLFWLLSALIVAGGAFVGRTALPSTEISLKTTPQYALITSFSFILVFAVIIILGIFMGRFYAAEVVYAKSAPLSLDEKIIAVQRAIQLNQNRSIFYITLADGFLSKAAEVAQGGGDLNQVAQMVGLAVESAKKATEISPNNVGMWQFLSTMYANARGIAPDADTWVRSSLERALELEPSNPVLYLSMANVKAAQQDFDGARSDLRQAISLKPDILIAYMRLALINAQQNNDLDAAIAAMEEGLKYGGLENAQYLAQTGMYYFNRNKEGDYPIAEIAFRRALALNPDYADALFALAILYETTDHEDAALPLYERVLELNPGLENLKQKIQSLKRSLAPAPPPAPVSDEEESE